LDLIGAGYRVCAQTSGTGLSGSFCGTKRKSPAQLCQAHLFFVLGRRQGSQPYRQQGRGRIREDDAEGLQAVWPDIVEIKPIVISDDAANNRLSLVVTSAAVGSSALTINGWAPT
jgi:hypothetical protein